MQVVLNRRDKERSVIQLHQEGKTIREVAQQVHTSFKDIGTIIRRIDGQEDHDIETKDLKNKSKATQALFLLSCGKRPIEVAVELNLTASEVHDIQEEYWVLNDVYELAFVYSEIKSYLPSFLKLFHCLKERRMLDEKNISNFSDMQIMIYLI